MQQSFDVTNLILKRKVSSPKYNFLREAVIYVLADVAR